MSELPICPVCGVPYQPGEPSCAACGLVFATAEMPAISPAISRATPVRNGQPPAPPQLTSGRMLGQDRYTLIRPLGQGGMGALYLAADHANFDRTVVIKAQTDHLDYAEPQAIRAAQQRFVAEARTLATLRHPAIPQIFAHFAEADQNYIVMEYIEGQDLEQRLSRPDETSGALIVGAAYPVEQVLRWAIELCGVLEYLASRTPPVIHHDIKPANLLLDTSNQSVRLIDFGTARARAATHGQATRKTTIFGTSGYAAPEQYRGISAPSSDVYALAATLYHLVTDDDPRGHPFSFPKIASLGPFGTVLSYALDPEPGRRPDAAKLRRECEALARSGLSATIETPDGSRLAKPLEIVQWAEQHWDAAREWVGGPLLEQIAVRWGQTKLAHDLRASASLHPPGSDAALDAVLAQLDPQGFGAALPRLTASRYALDFGRVGADQQPELTVRLTNQGRRFISATVHGPPWIAVSAATIALRPGAAVDLRLAADGTRWTREGSQTEQLLLRDGEITLRSVDLIGHAGRFIGMEPQELPSWLLIVLIVVIVVGYSATKMAAWSGLPSATPAPTVGLTFPSALPTAQLASGVPVASQAEAAIPPQRTIPVACAGGLDTVALSPDGALLAALCGDEEVQLIRLAAPTQIVRSAANGAARTTLAFAPDGQSLLVVAADRTERRRLSDLGLLRTVGVGGTQISPAAGFVAGQRGQAVEVWSLADGALVYSASAAASAVLSGNTLALLDNSGLTLVDLRGGAVTLTDAEIHPVWARFDPSGQQLVTGAADGRVALTDLASGRRTELGRYATSGPWLVYLPPTGSRPALAICLSSEPGAAQSVNLVRPALPSANPAALTLLARVQGMAGAVVGGPNAEQLAVYDQSGRVAIWEIAGLAR